MIGQLGWNIERFTLERREPGADIRGSENGPDGFKAALLPLLYRRGSSVRVIDERWRPRRGDVVSLMVASARQDEARALLLGGGWRRLASAGDERPEPASEPQPAPG